MTPPLAGLRVLELVDDVPGAFCGRQFAAWGAEVAMLERAGGSPVRARHPVVETPDGERHSLLWAFVAANKRAVSGPVGEALRALTPGADVLVTDWSAAELAALGCAPDQLRATHPHLVVVHLTPFGADGPYSTFRATDIVRQALSGYMTLNGSPDRAPLRTPGQIAAYGVGAGAFVGALAACYRQVRSGAGDLIEVSGMEALSTMTPFLKVQYDGLDRKRQGGSDSGVRYFPCKDGWVSFHPLLPEERAALSQALEIPEAAWPADLLEGPLLEQVARATAFFTPYTSARTVDEVFYGLEGLGVVCGRLQSPHDLVNHQQLEARDFYATVAHPGLGPLKFPRPPVKLRNGAGVEPEAPCEARAADLGWAPRPAAAAPARGLPLEGVKLVDFTQAWIGPFATALLATLGADVIKVESHKRPDVWRQATASPTAITDIRGERVNRSPHYNSVNFNKRNLTLDLTTPEGRALCLKLIADADIVADNYTPRVMAKFGLDYDGLCAVKPDIITVSSCGFGKTGPWADFKTNGSAVEGLGGWDWRHRYPGGEPLLMSFYQPDGTSGYHLAAFMLLGLLQRERTGSGEAFDAAMMEIAATHIGEQLLEVQFAGDASGPANRDPDISPNGIFPTAGEDRWIAISAPDEAAWRALVTMDGAPVALAEPRYATLDGRRGEEAHLEALLSEWTAGWDGVALMEALQARGVPAGIVRRFAEVTSDPHLVARSWFRPVTHPDMGLHSYNGFPWRFASCAMEINRPPPRLGEDSDTVLRDVLGVAEAEIADLMARGVTGRVF